MGEEREGHVFQPDFYYSLQEASSTYIDDYLDCEQWFSYLYSEKTAFRCEIEKIMQDDSPELYACPCGSGKKYKHCCGKKKS